MRALRVLVVTVVAVALAAGDGRTAPPVLDVQAHRGGMGLRPESSAAAFAYALALGVTTLELDVQVTEDGQAVVTHDRRTNPVVCRDTAAARPGDPEFPYMGKLVKDLTVAQLKTLDCGIRRPPNPSADPILASQVPVPGSRMMTLREVFDLVKRAGAGGPGGVRLNVEMKVEAATPVETAPRERFVEVVLGEVRRSGLIDHVSIQSFDWAGLKQVHEVEPRLPVVALVERDMLQVGRPGASPWLGGIDIDDFGGDPVPAAASIGVAALSPVHGYPQDATVLDPGYRAFTTPELVEHAHAAGMEVIPWTVDDIATMTHLIGIGVDGLITDYPDRLRDVLRTRGRPLPRAYRAGS